MARYLLQDQTTRFFFKDGDAPFMFSGFEHDAHSWVTLEQIGHAARLAVELWGMDVSIVERR